MALLKSKNWKTYTPSQSEKKFLSLCTDNETVTETYANLIKANEETAREVLPKWKKDRKTKASDDPRMVKAREELQIASDRNYRSLTENNREEVERHESKLHEQYNTTIEKDLDKLDDQQVETVDAMKDPSDKRGVEGWSME